MRIKLQIEIADEVKPISRDLLVTERIGYVDLVADLGFRYEGQRWIREVFIRWALFTWDEHDQLQRMLVPSHVCKYLELTAKPGSPLALLLNDLGLPANRADLKSLLGRWCILRGWDGDQNENSIGLYATPIADSVNLGKVESPSLRLLTMATGWEGADEHLPLEALMRLQASPEWVNREGSEVEKQ